jgi:hypothetical protein
VERPPAQARLLTRILQRATGMSFGRWCQQLHILIALQRLAIAGTTPWPRARDLRMVADYRKSGPA